MRHKDIQEVFNEIDNIFDRMRDEIKKVKEDSIFYVKPEPRQPLHINASYNFIQEIPNYKYDKYESVRKKIKLSISPNTVTDNFNYYYDVNTQTIKISGKI